MHEERKQKKKKGMRGAKKRRRKRSKARGQGMTSCREASENDHWTRLRKGQKRTSKCEKKGKGSKNIRWQTKANESSESFKEGQGTGRMTGALQECVCVHKSSTQRQNRHTCACSSHPRIHA